MARVDSTISSIILSLHPEQIVAIVPSCFWQWEIHPPLVGLPTNSSGRPSFATPQRSPGAWHEKHRRARHCTRPHPRPQGFRGSVVQVFRWLRIEGQDSEGQTDLDDPKKNICSKKMVLRFLVLNILKTLRFNQKEKEEICCVKSHHQHVVTSHYSWFGSCISKGCTIIQTVERKTQSHGSDQIHQNNDKVAMITQQIQLFSWWMWLCASARKLETRWSSVSPSQKSQLLYSNSTHPVSLLHFGLWSRFSRTQNQKTGKSRVRSSATARLSHKKPIGRCRWGHLVKLFRTSFGQKVLSLAPKEKKWGPFHWSLRHSGLQCS